MITSKISINNNIKLNDDYTLICKTFIDNIKDNVNKVLCKNIDNNNDNNNNKHCNYQSVTSNQIIYNHI